MEDVSKSEDGQSLDEFNRQRQAGKRIMTAVLIIVSLQALAGQALAVILQAYRLTDLIDILLWALILFRLYRGRTWAKFFYLFLSALSVISLVGLQALQSPRLADVDAGFKQFITWDLLINAALYVGCSIMIFSKKSKVFLDYQKLY